MSASDEGVTVELERLRLENARLTTELAQRDEQYFQLVTASSVPMAIVSLEEARTLDANQAYADFTGRSREEILATDPYELWVKVTHPEDLEAERALLARVVSGEVDTYRITKRYLLPDGRVRWGEMGSSVARDERGRVKYIVLAVRDVSQERAAAESQKELEDKLRQAQKLESIGRLAGGVAHDFNNRLLVIMGYVELLKRGVHGDAELESHADVVLASARRAADLTHQLLAYGRRQVLRPRSLDLNGVVDRLRRMLERVIGESVELVTVLGAKDPMLADPGQVEQVLMNLVLNARDAMPGGGRITIQTSDVTLGKEAASLDLEPGAYVSLTVEDTGPGVPEAIRRRIFEPFFTTKEVGKGTGLGLAMVEGIARQSGGAVSVGSSEAGGAAFRVLLPRATMAAVEAPATPAELVTRLKDQETLLVVDDEDDVRRLLVDVLTIGAYRVLEARDGIHALEVAERHPGPIDLVVTDVIMPKLSGPDFVDRLRAQRPGFSVLYVSGYADREGLRALGPHEHFLTKPFAPADLFRLARQILASRVPEPAERAG